MISINQDVCEFTRQRFRIRKRQQVTLHINICLSVYYQSFQLDQK